MDVYVLTENDVVLGVGTQLSVCEEIADRRGDRWSEWFARTDGSQVRSRSVTPHGILRDVQKIARVPLAGSVFPEAVDPLAGLKQIVPIDDRRGGAGAGEVYQTRERAEAIKEAVLRAADRFLMEVLGPSLTSPADPYRTSGDPAVFAPPTDDAAITIRPE